MASYLFCPSVLAAHLFLLNDSKAADKIRQYKMHITWMWWQETNKNLKSLYTKQVILHIPKFNFHTSTFKTISSRNYLWHLCIPSDINKDILNETVVLRKFLNVIRKKFIQTFYFWSIKYKLKQSGDILSCVHICKSMS